MEARSCWARALDGTGTLALGSTPTPRASTACRSRISGAGVRDPGSRRVLVGAGPPRALPLVVDPVGLWRRGRLPLVSLLPLLVLRWAWEGCPELERPVSRERPRGARCSCVDVEAPSGEGAGSREQGGERGTIFAQWFRNIRTGRQQAPEGAGRLE
jgi:hypothetical protein